MMWSITGSSQFIVFGNIDVNRHFRQSVDFVFQEFDVIHHLNQAATSLFKNIDVTHHLK
jgi:hypothetical protein